MINPLFSCVSKNFITALYKAVTIYKIVVFIGKFIEKSAGLKGQQVRRIRHFLMVHSL